MLKVSILTLLPLNTTHFMFLALVDAATAVAHNYQGTTRPVPGPQGVADDVIEYHRHYVGMGPLLAWTRILMPLPSFIVSKCLCLQPSPRTPFPFPHKIIE